MTRSLFLLAVMFIASSLANAASRDTIKIVGSSTVYPFAISKMSELKKILFQ